MKERIMSKQIIAIVLVVIIMVPMFLLYYEISVKNQTRTKTFTALEETTQLETSTIKAEFDGQYSVLESFASYFAQLEYNNQNDKTEIIKAMAAAKKAGKYTEISYITANGMGTNSNGDAVISLNTAEFIKTLEGYRTCTMEFSEAENEEVLVLRVPIIRDGVVRGALAASYDKGLLSSILTTRTHDGSTHFYICNNGGEMIASCIHSSDTDNTRATARHIIYEIKKGNSSEIKAKTSTFSDERGELLLDVNKEQHYVAFAPLGINEWTLYTIVSGDTIVNENNFFTQNAVILAGGFTLTSLIILFIVLHFERKKTKIIEHERELLRESEESYKIVENFSSGILMKIDLCCNTISFSKNYKTIFGREPKIYKFSDIYKFADNVYPDDLKTFNKLVKDVKDGAPTSAAEYRISDSYGTYKWHRVEVKTLYSTNGMPQRIIGKISDAEETNRKLEALRVQAQTDPLTKIYNREATVESINNLISDTTTSAKHALLIFDIDNFKTVNDTFGHTCGDTTLQKFAKTLSDCFGNQDIVGRLGGDEFVVFATYIKNGDTILKKANEVIKSVESISNGIGDTLCKTSCSIGIAIYPNDGADFKQLYANADIALYKAKAGGKHSAVLYVDVK